MSIEEIKEAVRNMPKDKVSKLKQDLYLESKSKGVLDAVQEKVISRKLLVFAAATCLFVW